MKKNIGKLPHLQHKSDEAKEQAEGKLMSTSMRQYTRKGK